MTGTTMSPTTPRGVTVLGLVGGAVGIAMLWASGVEFPIYPPPGLLILAAIVPGLRTRTIPLPARPRPVVGA